MESVPLTTADGHRLDADLLTPDSTPIGGAVVCHPHPQFGGDRFNPIVDAAWRNLALRGWLTIRFDFRSEFDGGVGERLDVAAALDELEARICGPFVVVGYSFGAVVGLATRDGRVAATVAVAPPLTAMPVEPPEHPTLVVVARHDQFTPPDAATDVTQHWPDSEMVVVESADHFLVGRAEHVAETVTNWLDARVASSVSPDGDEPRRDV